MKKIPLTQGQFALVDDEDYEHLMQWKWHAQKHKRDFIAARHRKRKEEPGSKYIYMHREVMGALEHEQVDHADHNTLNDQKHNLRVCTHAQNLYNTRPQKGTSRFKGVHWHHIARKWMSQITHQGKNIYLGLYINEEEAARAYDEAAKELFGEFAYLNFPEREEAII